MFFKIIGILWICLGIWWVMRPQGLKRRFRKKVKRSRRKLLFLIILLMAGLFLSAAKYAHGLLASAFLMIGVLAIIKAVFFFSSKAAEKTIDWWLEKPLWVWRVWAGSFILLGILFQKIG